MGTGEVGRGDQDELLLLSKWVTGGGWRGVGRQGGRGGEVHMYIYVSSISCREAGRQGGGGACVHICVIYILCNLLDGLVALGCIML